MEVYVLSFILCIGITLETSFSLLCPESIPTVSVVSRCPANVKEWASAAERKSCGQLRKIQNCSKAENFVYHCVLNKDATQLLEVCAPRFFLMGLCARFSEVNKRIINEPGLDCTKFDPPCPARFPSNESYKYQTCYRTVGKSQQQKESLHESTLFILYVAVGIAGVIILTSLILLLLGFKLNWIKCTCKRSSEEETGQMVDNAESEVLLLKNVLQDKDDIEKVVIENGSLSKCNGHTKENGTEKGQVDIDQKSDVKEEKMIQFRSLSGCTETRCSLKGVRTIGDLRNALSIKLQIPRPFVLVVDKENGIIFKDETVIETLKHPPNELMIGNQNRKKDDDEDDDESVENDVILNRRITSGKCRMSCGHFTAPDSLYEWTKEKLPCGTDKGLFCPKCRRWCWEIDELILKCNMSRDETIFYKQVASLNERTAKELEKAWRKQKNKSRSLPVLDDEYFA